MSGAKKQLGERGPDADLFHSSEMRCNRFLESWYPVEPDSPQRFVGADVSRNGARRSIRAGMPQFPNLESMLIRWDWESGSATQMLKVAAEEKNERGESEGDQCRHPLLFLHEIDDRRNDPHAHLRCSMKSDVEE